MSAARITLISPTKRLRLVPPSSDDDEAVATIRSHPTTLRFLPFLPKNFSIEDARIRRETRGNDPRIVDFHIHAVGDDGSWRFIGNITIFDIDETNNSCESGIFISPHLHRGGVATEAFYTILKYAFEDRKMHRVTFLTGSDNTPMRGLLENRLKASLEGVRRECWKDSEGKYSNACDYSILLQEWTGYIKEEIETSIFQGSH